MQQEKDYELIDCLKAAIGLIDLSQNEQLRQDANAICNYLENPNFRIVVFAPFNYGKSTLLNAILGNRALPMDLIPTTGAAIKVKYGEEIQTRILLKDRQEIVAAGTEILKQFATLDSDSLQDSYASLRSPCYANASRTMRSDVAAVEVAFPHPLLAKGVELIDLPGTNDREAQDRLVKEQLLTADLVIQVLDSRKLMTLQERENLRDWLSDRGIETVIFVVNFLNLLEAEEQKQVYTRLRFLAESFRAQLLPGISNLYRVDALPALRARLKGDISATQITGLSTFESALQTLVAARQEKFTVSLPRIQAIATQIRQVLIQQIQALNTEITVIQNKYTQQNQIKQQAQKLLQQGFQANLSDFQGFLYVPKLQEKYQSELALALQQNQFVTWKNNTFKPAILKHQQAVEKWLQQASEFFERQISEIPQIIFPPKPEVFLPPPPTTNPSTTTNSSGIINELSQFVLETISSVVIESTNLLFGEGNQEQKPEQTDAMYQEQVTRAYANAAADYLLQFSTQANTVLSQYEEIAAQVIKLPTNAAPTNLSQQHQLQLINRVLEKLNLVTDN